MTYDQRLNVKIAAQIASFLAVLVVAFCVGCPPAETPPSGSEAPSNQPEAVWHYVGMRTHRTRVPQGWLVRQWADSGSMIYVPDPKHEWLPAGLSAELEAENPPCTCGHDHDG